MADNACGTQAKILDAALAYHHDRRGRLKTIDAIEKLAFAFKASLTIGTPIKHSTVWRTLRCASIRSRISHFRPSRQQPHRHSSLVLRNRCHQELITCTCQALKS